MRFLRTFAFFFLVLLLGFSATSGIYAQSRTNSSGTGGIHQVRGRIYLPNGRSSDEPIRVELQSTNYSTLTLETDRGGSYVFQNLAPGNYTVVVDAGDQFEVTREYVTIDTDVPEPPDSAFSRPPSPRTFNVPINLQLKRTRAERPKNQVVDARWAAVPKQAIEHYNEGLALIKRDKADEAVTAFRRSINVYEQFAPAHSALGRLLMLKGKLDEALVSLRSAVQYDPANFDARLNYGVALLNKKDLTNASVELSKAAELDNTAVTPHYYLGRLYIETHDMDRALAEMETAKKLKGDMPFPLLHRYLGGIYLAKKMEPQAVLELEKYLAEDPKCRDAEKIRGTIDQLKKSQN